MLPARHRLLAGAGFQLVRGGWTASGNEVKQPMEDPNDPVPVTMPGSTSRPPVKVRYAHEDDSGSGGGGFLIDLDAPRRTSYQMYLVRESSADPLRSQ